MKHKFNITRKLFGTVLLLVCLFIALMMVASNRFIKTIHEARSRSPVAVTEVGYSILKHHHEEYLAGKVTKEEAQQAALRQIKSVRYEGNEYYWINDTTLPYPTMIMHSVNSSLDGKLLDSPNYNVAMGKNQNLFQAFAEVCLRDGEGFVDYLWPRPGQTVVVPKLSYVKLFKEWNWIIGTGVYIDDINEQVKGVSRIIFISTVAFLLMTFVGFYLLARNIINPIKDYVEITSLFAQGDFSSEVPEKLRRRGDEMGDLARAFHQMIANIRRLIESITTNANTVASSATELSSVSSQSAQSVQVMTERTATVAASAEEASSNTTSVAVSMEQATTNLSTVASATEEMSATIGEIATHSEKARVISHDAANQATNISEIMNRLGEAAQEIGKVTETITEISSQTNLLALNATIEAARAGVAGKGFAVVANEIKELAKQTATATDDIKAKIGGVQTNATSSIANIEKITTVIGEVGNIISNIATAIEEQSAVTRDVAGNIAQASNGVKDANERIAQVAGVSKNMAKEINGLNLAAGELGSAGEQVKKSSDELSKHAEQLKGIIKTFKV